MKYIKRVVPCELIGADVAGSSMADSITNGHQRGKHDDTKARSKLYTDTFAKECTRSHHPTKQGNGTPTKGGLHSTMAQCYLFDVLPPCCVFPILHETFSPPNPLSSHPLLVSPAATHTRSWSCQQSCQNFRYPFSSLESSTDPCEALGQHMFPRATATRVY